MRPRYGVHYHARQKKTELGHAEPDSRAEPAESIEESRVARQPQLPTGRQTQHGADAKRHQRDMSKPPADQARRCRPAGREPPLEPHAIDGANAGQGHAQQMGGEGDDQQHVAQRQGVLVESKTILGKTGRLSE